MVVPAQPRARCAPEAPTCVLEHGVWQSYVVTPWQGRASVAAANKGNKPRARDIHLVAGHDSEGPHCHVHLDEKLHDAVVVVTQESDSSFPVRVGFLKILHKCEVTFALPLGRRLSKDIPETLLPSLRLKFLRVVPVPEGDSVK